MGLDVPYTYLFFVIFTRFEFALKDRGILRNDRDEMDAVPGWERLRKSIDMPKDSDSELSASISYLTADETSPKKQVVRDRKPIYEKAELRGENKFQQAIDATKRVRDNLFHGGKSSSPDQERNEQLISHALVVIKAILNARPDVMESFMDLEFPGVEAEREIILQWTY